jgi:hypothetical protein
VICFFHDLQRQQHMAGGLTSQPSRKETLLSRTKAFQFRYLLIEKAAS